MNVGDAQRPLRNNHKERAGFTPPFCQPPNSRVGCRWSLLRLPLQVPDLEREAHNLEDQHDDFYDSHGLKYPNFNRRSISQIRSRFGKKRD